MKVKELIFGGGVKNAGGGAAGVYRDSIQEWATYQEHRQRYCCDAGICDS